SVGETQSTAPVAASMGETPKPPSQAAPVVEPTRPSPEVPASSEAKVTPPTPVQGAGLRAVAPPAPAVAAEKPPRLRTGEALEVVEKLLAEIEDRLAHVARMCSERQRLHMLVWICRARAVEEGQPGAREVEHAVARVARRLTEIGKMFWPGSVRAL